MFVMPYFPDTLFVHILIFFFNNIFIFDLVFMGTLNDIISYIYLFMCIYPSGPTRPTLRGP